MEHLSATRQSLALCTACSEIGKRKECNLLYTCSMDGKTVAKYSIPKIPARNWVRAKVSMVIFFGVYNCTCISSHMFVFHSFVCIVMHIERA